MGFVGAWVKGNLGIYSDNATARRDFRSQLRGPRSIVLWSVYLIVLIAIAMMTYANTADRGSMSIVEAQSSLQTFYQFVIGTLAGMVTLVGPAMAATTVVVERERRSLDLVFSAPVRPKTLLVGKMISAYRYMWMLLILSLPVAAVCVVLGGATWSEVLASFALLSLHALLFSAMALMVSAMAPKPVGAIVWTYFLVGAYCWWVSVISFGSIFGSSRGGALTGEAPFIVTLSPFGAGFTSGTYTVIGSMHVPNWLLFGVYVLFMSRFFLLGAASVLSPYNSVETKNLKLTGMVAAVLISGIIAYSEFGSVPWASVGGTAAAVKTAVVTSCMLPLGLLLFLPLLSCYNLDAERRFRPNGAFSIREMLRGTPAGGLPYLLTLVLLMMLTVWAVFMEMNSMGAAAGPKLTSPLVWSLGLWTFLWSLGRFTSALTVELKTARTLHLALTISLLALPLMLLPIFDPDQSKGLWFAYILYPGFYTEPSAATYRLGAGIAMFVLAYLIYRYSEKILRERVRSRRKPPIVTEGTHA